MMNQPIHPPSALKKLLPTALLDAFRKDVEVAVREQRIGYEESGRLLKFYEEGLQGYTYLEQ